MSLTKKPPPASSPSDTASAPAAPARKGWGMGTWVLLASGIPFLGCLLTVLLWQAHPALKVVMMICAAAFIGCATNSIAISMLFERWPNERFALPYTGIVPLNRDRIVTALARTVDRNLLSPEVIRRELSKRDLFPKIRDFAADKVRGLVEDEAFLESMSQRVVAVLRGAVRSDAFYAFIRAEVVKRVGVIGRIGDLTGLVDYDRLTCGICDELVVALEKLQDNPGRWREPLSRQVDKLELLDTETVAGWIGNQDSLWTAVLAEVKPEAMVREKLSQYSAAQVRDLIRNQTRKHLGWLELWGGLLGGLGGCLLAALDAGLFG